MNVAHDALCFYQIPLLTVQVLLDDPDIPGFQPALPDDFDLEAIAKEVQQEGTR